MKNHLRRAFLALATVAVISLLYFVAGFDFSERGGVMFTWILSCIMLGTLMYFAPVKD